MKEDKKVGDLKRWARWSLSWILTIGIVIILINKIPLERIIMATSGIDTLYCGIALLLSLFANLFVASEKYRMILALAGADISLWETMVMKVGTIPIKNLMPFKSGEAVRMIYLKRVFNLSYMRSGASVVANALFSIMALMVFFVVGASIHKPLAINLASFLILCILIPIFIHFFQSLSTSVEGLSKKEGWVRGRIFEIIRWANDRVVLWPTVLRIAIYSITLEGIKILNYWIIFHSLGINVSAGKILFLVPGAIFASSLPVTILGIGAREAAVVALFSSISGPEMLLCAGMVISLIEGVVPLLAGIFLMKPFFSRLMSLKIPDREDNPCP